MTRYFEPPKMSGLPSKDWSPYNDAHRERIRAHAKHDTSGGSMERTFEMGLPR